VHSNEFKLTVILATLRGDLTQREVGEKYNIQQPLVSLWKTSAIDAIRDDLAGRKKRRAERARVASPLDHLLAAADEESIKRLCAALRKTAFQIEMTLRSSRTPPADD
jgi:transposase-like protein